jgi:phosphoribosylglycinamide formyltransferase-1
MKPFTIAVFASGSGTNFQAIADEAAAGRLDVRIGLLVCDRPQAPVVERAHRAGVPVFAFRPKDYAKREDYEAEILRELREREIDLVVMAGYMRLITPVLVEPFYGKMINVHPSLLPAFPGVNAIGQALDYGVRLTGVTVHFVDAGMDTGPIIAQRSIEVQPEDTEETLAARVHAIEHQLYPEVIRWIREGRVRLDGRKVRIMNEVNN